MDSTFDSIPASRGRLTLLPGLRRLWRDEFTIQLGVDPARALLIDLPDPSLVRVLDLLDGSRTVRGVLRDAARSGLSTHDASVLLTALRDSRVLVEADALMPATLAEPVRRQLLTEAAAIAMAARSADCGLADLTVSGPAWATTATPTTTGQSTPSQARKATPSQPSAAEAIRRRAAAAVQVIGNARLVTPICAALARAGVGRVDPAVSGRVGATDDAIGGLLPSDTDRPRGTAAAEAVLRAAPHTDARTLRAGRATFVVMVGLGMPAQLTAASYARRRLPHLLVEERDEVLLVGPLVTPAGSPCLHCLDLHRKDRDPAWHLLSAQLATGREEPPATSIATTLMGVGVAVGQVLGYLDGQEVATIGASIEVGPPTQLRRRNWPAHPRCDCSVRVRARQQAPRGNLARVGPSAPE